MTRLKPKEYSDQWYAQMRSEIDNRFNMDKKGETTPMTQDREEIITLQEAIDMGFRTLEGHDGKTYVLLKDAAKAIKAAKAEGRKEMAEAVKSRIPHTFIMDIPEMIDETLTKLNATDYE